MGRVRGKIPGGLFLKYCEARALGVVGVCIGSVISENTVGAGVFFTSLFSF